MEDIEVNATQTWSQEPTRLNSHSTTLDPGKTWSTKSPGPTRWISPSPSITYSDDEWEGVNLGVPVAICIIVIILLLTTMIIAKKRRGRLRGAGRQHPCRVMSGGPAMSVDAYRRYPGTVPHSQMRQSQVQGRPNEVTLVVDPEPAPMYPGPRELPPSYEDVIKMSSPAPLKGNVNLGFSHSSNQLNPPDSSTSQQQQQTSGPSTGESTQNSNGSSQENKGLNDSSSDEEKHEKTQVESTNNLDNSENTNGNLSGSDVEKPVPEISSNDNQPKPD